MDLGEGTHPTVDFCPQVCHHIQKLPGFSTLLQTFPVYSVQPLGLVSPTFVALVSSPTQLWPYLMNVINTFWNFSVLYVRCCLCVIIHKSYLSIQFSISRPVLFFYSYIVLRNLCIHICQILYKVGANMQADFKLFFKDELEGHFPLISHADVEGSRCLGSERLTTPCANVIWCNASACSCNALVIWHPMSVSVRSEMAQIGPRMA